MSGRNQAPARALQRCLNTLLCDIQAYCLSATSDEAASEGFDQLAAASQFLPGSRSAGHCLELCRRWRARQAEAGAGARERLILREVCRCRESMQEYAPDDVLRRLLVDCVRAPLDRLRALPGDTESLQTWLRETQAACMAIVNSAQFLAETPRDCLRPWPPTARELAAWLCALDRSFAPAGSGTTVPPIFRRELRRCIDRCQLRQRDLQHELPRQQQHELAQEMKPELWQLQLLAGALLALDSMGRHRHIRHGSGHGHGPQQNWLREHCLGLIRAAARAQYQCPYSEEHQPVREVLRHALLLSSGDGPGRDDANVALAKAEHPADVALTGLPAAALIPARELLAAFANALPSAGHGAGVDWAALSLRLYRLLVCLRMLDGGFFDTGPGHGNHIDLAHWQILVASLHASANLCLQQSVVTPQGETCLLVLMRRLAGIVQFEVGTGAGLEPGSVADTADVLLTTVLLGARFGLRAQRHWQQLTLDLDAVQQDFAGVPVQHVLAAELRHLPAMGSAAPGSTALPQDALRDLRLLLKGARILNVQRIESLVLVMIEVYQEILVNPAFAETAEVNKAMLRAHRSLCRMLDQAAAWQTPGNARRMIHTLYACLEQWRGDSGFTKNGCTKSGCTKSGLSTAPEPGAVEEPPPGHTNDLWRVCMATTRRLRKLVRHQDDLDSIRVLLLELLRSQEDLIRRQAGYGAGPDSPPGLVSAEMDVRQD